MRDKRLLIVDDDASWLHCVPTYLFKDYTVETNLADGLKQIDGRKRWDAAIFDLCLMEGELPYGKGKLRREAGYILTLAFQDKFPGKKVAICSGYYDRNNRIEKLLDPAICRFFQKQKYMNPNRNRGWTTVEEMQKIPTWTGKADDIANFLLREPYKQFSSKWLDALLLEPNFCGIGVNLRKLIDVIFNSNKG